MTEMDGSGQQPPARDQPVLRAGVHGPLPLPVDKSGLVTLMPQRADVGNEFSDHIGRKAVIRRSLMPSGRVDFPTTQP
ncbi:hypothetical protein ACFTTN_17915 [Streptomyces niveus]|uniref:hypothetical protein n=1 Tax=Streptomyces niveus TaxID=193462 RepID=UPI003636F9A0